MRPQRRRELSASLCLRRGDRNAVNSVDISSSSSSELMTTGREGLPFLPDAATIGASSSPSSEESTTTCRRMSLSAVLMVFFYAAFRPYTAAKLSVTFVLVVKATGYA